MINVLIADDQRLLRESFKNILETNSDIHVVGCVTNGNEAYDFCTTFIPDVILMDIWMPVCNGINATKRIKAKYPKIKVLILTATFDELSVAEAIQNGADGYILKDIGTEELTLSIRCTAAGLGIIHKEVFNTVPLVKNLTDNAVHAHKTITVNGIEITLSEKDLNIIRMIVAGNDNKEIATTLFMAEGTVKNKITEIIAKLHLKDRTQLAVFALKNNLVL
ncbi:MAG: DNA-binding response regulator [Anaerocolumna sp.]|jgi:DNA-binding NarL/FixJ family response regulator|nr:DNA-binding response regulator [Anaerocolumna sp.]